MTQEPMLTYEAELEYLFVMKFLVIIFWVNKNGPENGSISSRLYITGEEQLKHQNPAIFDSMHWKQGPPHLGPRFSLECEIQISNILIEIFSSAYPRVPLTQHMPK